LKSTEPIPPSGKTEAKMINRNRSTFLAEWQKTSIRCVSELHYAREGEGEIGK